MYRGGRRSAGGGVGKFGDGEGKESGRRGGGDDREEGEGGDGERNTDTTEDNRTGLTNSTTYSLVQGTPALVVVRCVPPQTSACMEDGDGGDGDDLYGSDGDGDGGGDDGSDGEVVAVMGGLHLL